MEREAWAIACASLCFAVRITKCQGYMPMMDKVRRGKLPWMKLDALHRMILDDLLAELQINFRAISDQFHINFTSGGGLSEEASGV
jgi:hypothetical protein